MADTKTWAPRDDGCIDIGRVSTIRGDIDPDQRITKKLRRKMNIVDLIPCAFNINYSTMLKFEDEKLKLDFSPEIQYEKPVNKYIKACTSYGLKGYEFLRLHLTDISSVSDDISNEYSKSIIDDAFNSITASRLGQVFQMGNKASEAMGKSESGQAWLVENFKKFASTNENTGAMVDLAADVLTHGSRVAFPKIWTNNTYSPNLNCVIKLASPYGHPKAVNEFIIKPLSYLLILFSPSTGEGLITHRPSYFTLKSYGLSNLTLCYLGQMNIRRGGDDSSYNSFNQPLTVELSLTFNAVTEGFACFTDPKEGTQHKEKDILKGEDSIALQSFEKDFDQPNALFPTLKSMINSFRPYDYKPDGKEEIDKSIGIQTNTTQTSSGLTSGGIISELPREELNFASAAKETTFDAISSVDVTVQDKTIVVFTLNDSTSNLYELQILTDSGETQTKIIDINQFMSDQDIQYFEKTSDNNIVLKFNKDDVPKVLKIRNVTNEVPGIWSDDVIINNNEEQPKISTSIVPSYKSYTENIRWQLKDEDNNQYGPYIGSSENCKNIENNTYKLQVVDLADNIKYEENNIVISDNILNKQIILEEQYSDISTNFNIPQDLDINDFSYYLISDFNETTLLECFDNQKNTFTRGKYYYLIKYKDQIISKLNIDIDLSIIIDQSIVEKTITIEKINNELKITSVI